MSFEAVVIITGIAIIAALLAAHFLTKPEQELHEELTRMEQLYFEPEVYAAQQAEIEAERQLNIKKAEGFLEAGRIKYDKL